MTMHRHHRLVFVQRALQARAAEKWKDGLRLAHHCFFDRRVVRDRDLHRRMELRQPVIQLDGFALSTNVLMPISPNGISSCGAKPPQNPLVPANPTPSTSWHCPSSTCTPD